MENEISESNEAPSSQPMQNLSISPSPQMSLKERFDMIRSIGEECIQEDELERLLANKPNLFAMTDLNHLEECILLRSIGEECIQEDELERLLANKPQPICYDRFEPSGRMHIAQGVLKAINVNKQTSAGCKVKIWIADWFAQLNNKMDGDLKKIQTIGQYLIEIWKALGMNIEGGQINSRAHEYCPLVMDIARRNKLPRIVRCCQIMGRTEQDELTAAQIFYPCMQCADIFFCH
ncbi:hypothetical protein ACS0TY_031080 [Phlomoides rotata]